MSAITRTAVLLWMTAVLGACATVEFDAPKSVSHATQGNEDTSLGRRARELSRDHPGESGFHLIADGVEAMAVRVSGAIVAERTLDTQYYLINDDMTSAIFIMGLLEAADRGVRVRLLLDDMLTMGQDSGMLALDAHPNLEMRIFNPFANRTVRAWNFLTDFGRVNRRMHNKSFIVDNQMAVIGGRNIGDEYFAAREEFNFGDLDVLTVGPVVNEISDMFDMYWNHRLAVPASTVIDPQADHEAELSQLRKRLDERIRKIKKTHYADLITDYLETRLGPGDFDWVPYELVYDSPDKAVKSKSDDAASIRTPLAASIETGQRELMVISPYFVPTDGLIKAFKELRARGMEAVVITNSLAANNHSVVHAGYAPARKELLEMGVGLYEMRPDVHLLGVEKTGREDAVSTLHTKAFLVDRERFYLGSFNWDPRSAYLNTEMGIILNSPELAESVANRVESGLPDVAYRLELDGKGKIIWIAENDGEQSVYTKDPETGWWKRAWVRFVSIFPIEGQL